MVGASCKVGWWRGENGKVNLGPSKAVYNLYIYIYIYTCMYIFYV